MPRTPVDTLPMGLVFSSSNLTHLPFRAAMSTCSRPLVRRTSMRASPSLSLTALIPPCLGLEYASREVFFTTPLLVTRTMKWLLTKSLSFSEGTLMYARILSSGMLRTFWMALPLEALEPSGICHTFSQ